MGTLYPGALDALTNPASSDTLDSPSHSDQHINANDAIEAIQAELGTDPAGSHTDLKTRLSKIGAGVGVYHNVNQAHAHATYSAISFNTVIFDNASFKTSDTVFTIPAGYGGKYIIVAQLVWVSTNAAGFRGALISKNGVQSTDKIFESWHTATITGVTHAEQVTGVVELMAGDTISILGYQSSGASLDLISTATKFSMVRIGD